MFFHLSDVSFYSWFLIRTQTTCGPIPTFGWQYLVIVHWAGCLRGRKKKTHAIVNQVVPCARPHSMDTLLG